jgi:hypothetical protein
MEMQVWLTASTLTLATIGAGAQAPSSFDGIWRMTTHRPGMPGARGGEVVLNGNSGTWKSYAFKTIETLNNPCIGNTFPLSIKSSAPGADLTFRVTESQRILGCPDFDVVMHTTTANRLEGKTSGDVEVTMERD